MSGGYYLLALVIFLFRRFQTNTAVPMIVLYLLMLPGIARADCPLSVADWGYIVEVPTADLTNVAALSAGYQHGLALKSDGSIVAWGDNSYGQTNIPPNATNAIAIAAGDIHSLALKSDGSIIAWGYDFYGEAVSTNLPGAVAIAAGGYHNLVLMSNSTVVAWGDNTYGQSTPPPNLTNVTAIAAGESHSMALKTDGTVVVWGDTNSNQSAVPADLTGVIAIAVGGIHSLALKSNGTVVAWGDDSYGQATPPNTLTGVVAIAAGYFHSVALKDDGTVVGWGENTYGQSESNSLTGVIAIAAGGYHNIALNSSPIAPSKIAAKIVATNQINLSWPNSATTIDLFKIERATNVFGIIGAWEQIGMTIGSVTNYSDTNVSLGMTFSYRVRAQNSCGNSLPSLPIDVAMIIPDPPYMSVSIGDSNVVDLFWYEYSAAVNGFSIERAPNAGDVPGAWMEIAAVTASNSINNYYADAGVLGNSAIWYRVRATNAIGRSDFSAPVRLVVVAPTAPTDLLATPFPDRIELYWSDVFGGVMGFRIERAPDNAGTPGAWTQVAEINPDSLGFGLYINAPVTTNTTYWFRVRAFNWIGASPYSLPMSATVSTPGAPSNLTAVNNWRNQIQLAWTNVDGSFQGFKIERATKTTGGWGSWETIADVPPSARIYFDSGLSVYATYRYRIRAYNSVGDSPASNEAAAFVRDSQFVRVMQWNTERALGREANNFSFPAQCIARVINFTQPDVLLLNEVDAQSLSAAQNQSAIISWVTNNIPYFGTQSGTTFYVVASSQSDGFIRNAAISRFPILNATTFNDGLRGLHSFTVQISASNSLQVFHTHLKCCADDCNRKQVEAQFDANTIAAFRATNSSPYIFAGDWNEEEERQPPVCTLSGSYHPITTIRQGASLMDFKPASLTGDYRTWSSQDTTPSIRFDYILASSNRLAQPSGYVFHSAEWGYLGYTGFSYDNQYASDHYPVIANYSLPGAFDIWQAKYFGSSTNSAAAPDVDPDTDGLSNLQEFFAGTAPTNAASVLRITSIIRTNNDMQITWQTAGGKTNRVQASPDLFETFTNISPDLLISGTGDTTTNYLDPGAGTNFNPRFYRIRVAP